MDATAASGFNFNSVVSVEHQLLLPYLEQYVHSGQSKKPGHPRLKFL